MRPIPKYSEFISEGSEEIPEYLYHVTYDKNLKSIRKKGLIITDQHRKWWGLGAEVRSRGKIFLTKTMERAKMYGNDILDMSSIHDDDLRVFITFLRVRSENTGVVFSRDTYQLYRSDYYTVEPIAPEHIEIYWGGAWVPLVTASVPIIQKPCKRDPEDELAMAIINWEGKSMLIGDLLPYAYPKLYPKRYR
jgi:hypothetical protein